MAISPTVLTSGVQTPSGTAVATASISPTASRLLIATCSVRFDGTPGATSFTVTGNGLTWARIGEAIGGVRDHAAFWALTGGSPSAGAVTFTEGDPNSYIGTACMSVIQWDGIDLATPLGIGATAATGGDVTLSTLSIPGTPASGDATFVHFGTEDNTLGVAGPTGSSWADLVTVGPSSDTLSKQSWDSAHNQSPVWTWSTTNQTAGAVGVIIKAGAGGDVLMPQIWM